MKVDVRAGEFYTVVSLPLQRLIRHTVAGDGRTESQRAADEIEQVRLPEDCAGQFDHDQIAGYRYLTDRMSRCLLLPGVRGSGIQHQSTQQDNSTPRDAVHAVPHSGPLRAINL